MKALFKTRTALAASARTSICVFAFLAAFGSAANAETLKSARVTQIIKDVKLLGDQGARTAAVSDEVREGAAVRTGVESRAELTFADLTITRLGANTVFSFNEGARQVNLDSGALLLQVPKGGAAVRINTAAATAAITGGTCLCESNKGFPLKVLVMEGAGQVCSKEHPDQCETAHGGEMVTMTVDGQITKPTKFKTDLVYKTSKLINGFPPLPNADLIFQVIEAQEVELLGGPFNSDNPIDTQDQRSAASPTPSPPPQSTPGPTAPPSKFGPPTTITSPNPYVINSGTQIQTDPTIITNGVTSFGKIYRDETQDGPVPIYLYGSSRPFDAQVFQVGSGNEDGAYAVFKFSSLQLIGNPTISTANGGATNVALVSVGNITSGAPGGTLTFAGLQDIFIGTQNGSINLGPELAFSGLSKLEFYARGAGSALTLASPISTTNKLKLYAEGTIQVNADENVTSLKAISGGDFLAGSGTVTATDIEIHSLSNINIDGSKFPDLPSGGGSISLDAAGTLNIAVTGGTNTRDAFSAQGTTINLTSASPVVLTFDSASAIFTGGSGGIVGPNVGLAGANMEISTTAGGNIHLYSVDVLNSTLTGFVHAAGSFTSEAGVTIHELTAGSSITIGGSIIAGDITAGSTASGTINVTGRLAAFNTVTAGGNITADTVAVPTINAPNGILTAGSGGILPFIEDSSGPNDGAMIQHTHNVASVVSPNGIDFSGNQFNGIDGFSSGGLLTINATTLLFDPATGIGIVNFNGADAGGFNGGQTPTTGGDGGVFIANATGDISTTSNSPITATTGLTDASGFSGKGGTVTLASTTGTVTVDSTIQVSSDDPVPNQTPPPPVRRSAQGGNINLTSGKDSGVAINVTNSAQLLALLNGSAPGPGGTITILATGASSQANVSGIVHADRGVVDVRNTGDNGEINIAPISVGQAAGSNTIDMRADIVKIGALGTTGMLTIGAGTISADTILQLYAGGSNGTLKFIADVTLSSGTAMHLAANTITILPNITVTINGDGGPANVYTNNPDYSGFGGTNPSNGTFGGNGANAPQPLPSAPPFGPPPQHPQHLPAGH